MAGRPWPPGRRRLGGQSRRAGNCRGCNPAVRFDHLSLVPSGIGAMTAAELSAILTRLGVPVMGHREADDDFAGLIRVTETVHVELPKEGGGAVVVRAVNAADFEC